MATRIYIANESVQADIGDSDMHLCVDCFMLAETGDTSSMESHDSMSQSDIAALIDGVAALGPIA